MEDRDSKKPFVIPKTHTSNKDIVISEKPDSRNVIELFSDIKSSALDVHFDFRQNYCTSCDAIRSQKLQKIYNEKRIKMKKDQEPIERFGFHLINYRDVALNVANNGLQCGQLSFPIKKYLGNPKDGVHLSRRPDVLLTSSGAQGLYRFGLLVCKILLGKGYATIPSIGNKQLSAQIHYDHHFCKVQPINNEQLHIEDLLANSLIFCYELNDLETMSQPSQILPIAILWYDLTEKFSPEWMFKKSIRTKSKKESVSNNDNSNSKTLSLKKKSSNQSMKLIPSHTNASEISSSILKSTFRENSNQDKSSNKTSDTSNPIESGRLSKTTYPNHLLVPYNRLVSSPSNLSSVNVEHQHKTNTKQNIINSRDPRLLKTKRDLEMTSSETIPLSQDNLTYERSLSSGSLSVNQMKDSMDDISLISKSSSLIKIPLNSSTSLTDPRLKILKNTRTIFYLELEAVKHAIKQQKRLNNYYDSKTGLTSKTGYTVLPYFTREISNDEYVSLLNEDNHTNSLHKHFNGIDYSLLQVPVIDCFNFGLVTSTMNNQMCIDLEKNENKLAFEQIEMSNELLKREKQINSQHIRIRLREKRQRKIQQQINQRKNQSKSSIRNLSSLPNSKLYITNGRQILKEHKPSVKSLNTHVPSELVDFFSREYKNENRPYVKHILAELLGIFMEKYHIESNQNEENKEQNQNETTEYTTDDQTKNFVIDMDIESSSSQGLCDHDERFRLSTPSLTGSSFNEMIFHQPLAPLTFSHTLSNESNPNFDSINYIDLCYKPIENFKEPCLQNGMGISNMNIVTKCESNLAAQDETVVTTWRKQFESSLSEHNSNNDDRRSMSINNNLQQEEHILLPLISTIPINTENDSNRSLDDFVRVLEKEAYISKSTDPIKNKYNRKRAYDYHHNRYHHRQQQRKRRKRLFDANDNRKKKTLSNYVNFRQPLSSSSNNTTKILKSRQKKISSTRTVTLTSKYSTISNENHEKQQNTQLIKDTEKDSKDETIIRRIKIDPDSTISNLIFNAEDSNENDVGLKSIVTVPITTTDHNQRHDIHDQQRNTSPIVSSKDNKRTKSSRSRSRSKSKDNSYRSSTNSRRLTIKTSKSTSKSKNDVKSSRTSSESDRKSSNNNNHRHVQLKTRDNKHRHERRQSADLSNHQHKHQTTHPFDRHDYFNETSYRNSASSTYHQHCVNDLIPHDNIRDHQKQSSVRHKRFNYNHQSVADHPRFLNTNGLPAAIPSMNFHYSKSSIHRRSPSPVTHHDRHVSLSYYEHHHRDEFDRPPTHYSYLKSFDNIEHSHDFHRHRTNLSFEEHPIDYPIHENFGYSIS